MNRQQLNNVLVTLFLIAGLLSYCLWKLVKDVEFYQCIAITSALGSLIIMLNVRAWAKRMAFVALVSCSSTVIDEFFPDWFNILLKHIGIHLPDNTIFTINDYLITFIAFLVTFIIPSLDDRFKR